MTVLNSMDNGPGSLRDTVGIAAPGDTIVFANILDGATITLTTGQIDINQDLTIIGPGRTNLTISGDNSSRIFKSYASHFVISDLTLTKGYLLNPSDKI